MTGFGPDIDDAAETKEFFKGEDGVGLGTIDERKLTAMERFEMAEGREEMRRRKRSFIRVHYGLSRARIERARQLNALAAETK